ncbi:MAG: hypothetical protein ACRC42_04390 [Mycoplasma sp.]
MIINNISKGILSGKEGNIKLIKRKSWSKKIIKNDGKRHDVDETLIKIKFDFGENVRIHKSIVPSRKKITSEIFGIDVNNKGDKDE